MLCPPSQLLPTSIPASPPSSPPARALSSCLGHPLSPTLSPPGSLMARLLVGKELFPLGTPGTVAGWERHMARRGEWQRGRPWPVPLSPPAGYRVVPAARKRPVAALPRQLAASPAWHPLPARSCLHTPPAGPSPKPQRAQHPPPALRQKAQPDPSPRRNFADDGADAESGPARKRFALTPMTDLSPVAGLTAPNTVLRTGSTEPAGTATGSSSPPEEAGSVSGCARAGGCLADGRGGGFRRCTCAKQAAPKHCWCRRCVTGPHWCLWLPGGS